MKHIARAHDARIRPILTPSPRAAYETVSGNLEVFGIGHIIRWNTDTKALRKVKRGS